MTDSKQDAIELIRSHGEEIRRLVKYGDEPYKSMAITVLTIAGEQ